MLVRILQDRRRTLRTVLTLIVLIVSLTLCYIVTRPTELQVIVRDAETGVFLSGALVEVRNANGQKIVEAVTGEDGEAEVRRLIPGTEYRVLARQIDHVPAERRNVSVKLHKITTVRMPLRPQPGGRLYVGANRAYIAVIDTASYRFVAFGQGPEEMKEEPIRAIVPHPYQSWLYASTGDESYLLDATSMEPIAELGVSGEKVAGLTLSHDGSHLLALVESWEGRLAVMDPRSAVVRLYIGLPPEVWPEKGSILTGESAELYVASNVLGEDYWLRILDIRAGEVHSVPVRFPAKWAALSADGTHLIVGSPDDERLVTVDRYLWEVDRVADIGLGISALAMNPERKELYLVNQQLGLLIVLDAETLETIANVPVGQRPVAVAVDSRGERVYVANAGSKDVSVMDVETRQIIWTVDIGLEIFSLAVR